MRSQRISQTLGASGRLTLNLPVEFVEVRSSAGAFTVKVPETGEEFAGISEGLSFKLSRPVASIVLEDETGASNPVELFLAVGVDWRSSAQVVTNVVEVSEASDEIDDAADVTLAAAVAGVIVAANPLRRLLRLTNTGSNAARIGKASQVAAGRGDPLDPGQSADYPTRGAVSGFSTGGTTIAVMELEDT